MTADEILRMVSAASDARPEPADDIAAERAAVESERAAAELPGYPRGLIDLRRMTKRNAPSVEPGRQW